MITRNTDREEKVVAAIADEVKKIEANKALDASTMKHTDSTTARELQAIQMASFFVGKFYKVAELFSVEIEKTAEEIEANAIATEIAEKVISVTGK